MHTLYWDRDGELVLRQPALIVGDQFDWQDWSFSVVPLPPGAYQVLRLSHATSEEVTSVKVRLTSDPDCESGRRIGVFHSGSGGIAFREQTGPNPIYICYRTVFGDGHFEVRELLNDGTLVGIEVDLVDVDRVRSLSEGGDGCKC